MRIGGRLWAGALMLACHAGPQAGPVPVEGAPADLAALAGTWVGSYRSEVTGRHGTVTFRLRAGQDTARGEVTMTFSPALALYDACGAGAPPSGDFCRTIEIAVVRVRGNRIRGTLAPYWDPDCECRAHTVFEGELAGSHVAGRFTSRRETRPARPVSGEWFADRRQQ